VSDIVVRATDGRELLVAQAGTPDGPAVVFHHGWPGCRLLPPGFAEAAAARGLRLVSFDRAGYGGSSRAEGRTVGDVAGDTAAIADALGIAGFAAWGVSGGGPHALACGALLSERVTAVAVVAGVAPFDSPGLDFCAGMGDASREEFALARAGGRPYESFVRAAVAGALATPRERVADTFDSLLSPPDLALVMRESVGDYLDESKWESLGGGPNGWLDDGLACVAPWGFELSAIEAPVLLLQGGQDLMVPAAHADAMARELPRPTHVFEPEEGHMTLGFSPERPLDWLRQFSAAQP
jgi:pimeloyl-ACP methyl ester carboxylesterase